MLEKGHEVCFIQNGPNCLFLLSPLFKRSVSAHAFSAANFSDIDARYALFVSTLPADADGNSGIGEMVSIGPCGSCVLLQLLRQPVAAAAHGGS